MLIRFGVANHRSIRDNQELSMVASSLRDIEDGLTPVQGMSATRLIPAAVIYGANASGKSNIVKALEYARFLIEFSHSHGKPGGGVRRQPFKLDTSATKLPTSFDFDLAVSGIRYHYGFSADDAAFKAEWLYAFPTGRQQLLFEREGQSFTFGRALKGRNRVIADLTRDNSLFFSAAIQNGHEQLSNIWKTIESWEFDENAHPSGRDIINYFEDISPDPRIASFLERIGTGVTGVSLERRELDEEKKALAIKFQNFIEEIAPSVKGLNTTQHETMIITTHKASDGGYVSFSPDDESDGTRRLLALLSSVFRALDHGSLLVVDELNSSLHTLAAEAIVTLFCDRRSNPNGAQLICTTHDTNLLRSSALRRDQIWFTEKDNSGSTHIYPLSDFKTRASDNFEKGYLQGRYGAIPFAGDIQNIIRNGNLS